MSCLRDGYSALSRKRYGFPFPQQHLPSHERTDPRQQIISDTFLRLRQYKSLAIHSCIVEIAKAKGKWQGVDRRLSAAPKVAAASSEPPGADMHPPQGQQGQPHIGAVVPVGGYQGRTPS
jgi:hypothetical protein